MRSPFGPPSATIRSRDYSSCIHGGLLTDARINHYARLGRYGRAEQLAMEEARASRKRTKKFDTVRHALHLLGL